MASPTRALLADAGASASEPSVSEGDASLESASAQHLPAEEDICLLWECEEREGGDKVGWWAYLLLVQLLYYSGRVWTPCADIRKFFALSEASPSCSCTVR